MGDEQILKDLRAQVLDESQSLGGLLRMCLALGAVTGSDELRAWAANELRGYPEGAPVPEYRQLYAQLLMNTMSGQFHSTGQQIDRLLVPKDLQQLVPERLHLRQPVEELAGMAARGKAITMTSPTFPLVASRWSRELPMFQDVLSLYWSMLPSTIAGIVDNVRTTLVEIVVDLAKDVPLDSIPSKAKVDAAVQVHINNSNDNNSISVTGDNIGVIGQGSGSTQNQNNALPVELTQLIDQMRVALDEIEDPEQRADAQQAIEDFDEAVTEDDPKPDKIKTRSRALERITTAIGKAAVTEAVNDGIALAAEHFHLLT